MEGAINLKPNKPDPSDGRRNYLVVNTWLYKVEQYLALMQIANPCVILNGTNRILYPSTFLSGTAAVWWYTLVQANQTPSTWEQFKDAMTREFVPEDHVRRARGKLRELKQSSSVSKYLSEFRNIVLTIPDVTDGEKWDKFCAGLKYDVRLEVMKATVTSFEEAAQIALRVDSALWSAGNFASGASPSNAPTPMGIGNMEKRRSDTPRQGMTPQRLKDLRNNACFTCHKVGCRPWKHRNHAAVSNLQVEEGHDENHDEDERRVRFSNDDDSENWCVLQI